MIRSSLVVLSLLLMAACKQLSPAEPTEVELEWPTPAPTQVAPTEAAADTPPAKADDSAQGTRPEPAPKPAPGP
jgi:hypothetical protein